MFLDPAAGRLPGKFRKMSAMNNFGINLFHVQLLFLVTCNKVDHPL